MYRNENRKEILEFLKCNNFGILVSNNEANKIIATHIPFIFYEKEQGLFATTHISKANEQWKNVRQNNQSLLIFQGAHSYISSSWYDHINVPTWDYIAVHLYGNMRILGDSETLEHLNDLVNHHEALEEQPTSLEKMTMPYVTKEMKGLVAIEIAITEMYSAFKLSQNRDVKNLSSIIEALNKRGDENSLAIANELVRIKNAKVND